jgi:glycosyltransferase involved in cell wall biosynthesis
LRRTRERLERLKSLSEPAESRWTRHVDAVTVPRRRPLIRFSYFPRGNWNDYARLIYSRLPEFGFEPRPVASISQLADEPAGSVFNLHWTRSAQAGTATRAFAEQKTQALLAPIEDYITRGGRLVWTIHEPLDHDCRFPDLEVGLRSRLAAIAHGIHLLHPSMAVIAEPYYRIDPARTFVVEHPLYDGAYQDLVGRESARAILDVAPDQVLLLAFGAIRPYKGFERLVAAMPEIRRRTGRDVRLIVAGRVLRHVDPSRLQELVRSTDGVRLIDDGPAAESVAILFRAADLAVLPYHQLHNSGVLMLSLTFGIPAVVPRTSLTEDLGLPTMLHLFDSASDDDLIAVVVAAIASGSGPTPLDPAFRERYSPQRLSAEFAARIREIAARPG